MFNAIVKTDTPPPKILRAVGKIRLFALVLALLFCSTMTGCSNNKPKDDEIYLADIYVDKVSSSFSRNTAYFFNYVYTHKFVMDAVYVKVRVSSETRASINYEYYDVSPLYISGAEQNTGWHNGEIKYLTPYMSITVPIVSNKSFIELVDTLEIEIYHTQFYPKETTICKKKFTHSELKAQSKPFQTLLDDD